MCILEINNVSKKYKRRNRELTVLDGLNLKVEKGSFNAVEGESGSGKSTLLGILAGLTDIDEGSVIYHKDSESGTVIDIHSLTESERAKLRRHDIVYMPQQQEIISRTVIFIQFHFFPDIIRNASVQGVASFPSTVANFSINW